MSTGFVCPHCQTDFNPRRADQVYCKPKCRLAPGDADNALRMIPGCVVERVDMRFSRAWAMPNADTFSVKPIGNFVRRYLIESSFSVDPFARNKRWATYTNDLNPETEAEHHMDAVSFLEMLENQVGGLIDLVILDPPYSPRQISECYKAAGKTVGMKDTQSALLYKAVRDACMPLLSANAVVLSFGWNSVGMGKSRGFVQEEILLVCHGGAHNDTICLAERRDA
ncbi:hypothetical protein [Sphingopyxis sp.]|uniref:hypothetical protein n=1 Tax=Sphingopyxis sp. TaxID=1908224 RepID=UPI0025CDDE79|nr:hypothetical protein [Sphingopyxis sp.]MBK6414005.1 adenine-specific DNA methylase [Sphingopyxis sp.]